MQQPQKTTTTAQLLVQTSTPEKSWTLDTINIFKENSRTRTLKEDLSSLIYRAFSYPCAS